MTPQTLQAYFTRIGYDGEAKPARSVLESLHRLHPGAIPFEQPMRYYFVINRKTATALGIKVTGELLLQQLERRLDNVPAPVRAMARASGWTSLRPRRPRSLPRWPTRNRTTTRPSSFPCGCRSRRSRIP